MALGRASRSRLLASGALALGACAAPANDGPAPSLAAVPSAPAEPEVRYVIELVEPVTPLVVVHVACAGDADGESDFTLSEGWGGLAETGNELELVEVLGAEGALEPERVSSSAWRVRHAPGEPLALAFELAPTHHRDNPSPPEYYLPILEPGLLHALGAQTLPAPAHLAGEAERALSLEWTGFAEQGWRTISSFAEGPGEVRVRRSLDAFRHALFLAGALRLQRVDVHGRALWISLSGTWSFGDDEFVDLATRIVESGREFFSDFDKPFYLISVIPVGTGDPGSVSFGGTGLTDSFALFMTHNVGLERTPRGGDIAWLLAHELFHEWNGHAISLAQPEQLGYWFSEGFTDFYARRLLLRDGLLTPDEYLASWNHKLQAYAANPQRNAPAERVLEAFWTERDIGNLPYQRGDLVALLVDHAIQLRSVGGRSLDDLMRELVRRARAGAAPCSNEDLLAAIAEFAGEGTAAAVRRVALEGADPELAPDACGAELELLRTELPVFDTGFDHERTLKEGVVSGVVPGGCAARAGLSDGMHIRSWSVNYGRTDVPIEVRVGDAEGERTLSFLPVGVPVSGYQLHPRLR